MTRIVGVLTFLSVSLLTGVCSAEARMDEHILRGKIPQLCIMPSAQPHVVDIVQANAISATDGTVDSTTLFDMLYSNAMCNYKAIIGLKSKNGGITKNNLLATALPSPATGFINRIDYKAIASWGDFNVELTTSGLPGATKVVEDSDTARMGDVTLKADTEDGTVPVEAGDYEDTLYISLGAGF